MLSADILRRIFDSIGPIDQSAIRTVDGGSINRSFKVPTLDGAVYFLKTNNASAVDMFSAERDGLLELEKAGAIKVPAVVTVDRVGDTAFLLMEYLNLCGQSTLAGSRLGELLAKQHQYESTEFGWYRDNTIGSTPQHNEWGDDWIRFFGEKRLGYQLNLAVSKGFYVGPARNLLNRGEKLLQRLPDFFVGYHPRPSLLHGDLWGGNWGVIADQQPVIFDPAVYYGDREADMAMTRLFGGFGAEFFAAYNEAWPLDDGFERRCDLYNLYHVLNHLNLFGDSYLSQVSDMLDRLLM